jgi:hypothetical protein
MNSKSNIFSSYNESEMLRNYTRDLERRYDDTERALAEERKLNTLLSAEGVYLVCISDHTHADLLDSIETSCFKSTSFRIISV